MGILHETNSAYYQIGANVVEAGFYTADLVAYWLFAHKYWTASFVIRGTKKQKLDV